MTSDHVEWFDELALDPEAHPVAMGTRSLRDRPWLVVDDHVNQDLAIKADLLSRRRAEVLFTTDHSHAAATELANLVGASVDDSMHPIERAARVVQEDLCLMNRRPDGWYLDASCLCFPTRWHLSEKVGRHIAEIHGPVGGYQERVTTKVDQLLDRTTDRPVWRRNWFVMSDPTLFQPDRPATETIVAAEAVHDDLYIRSERQTLRQIDDGWIAFTIRIQQEPLRRLLTTSERTAAFADWVASVPAEFGVRRHMSEPQRVELLAGLS